MFGLGDRFIVDVVRYQFVHPTPWKSSNFQRCNTIEVG